MSGKSIFLAAAIALVGAPIVHAESWMGAQSGANANFSQVPERSLIVTDRLSSDRAPGYVHEKYTYFDSACGDSLRDRTTVDYYGPSVSRNNQDARSRDAWISDRQMCNYIANSTITSE